MPDSARQHKVRPTLRWKLSATVAILVAGVVALFLVLVRDAVQRFVRHDEIERLRPTPGTTREMVAHCLTVLGYDGLYADDCGCSVTDDFMPYQDSCACCEPGIKVPCPEWCGEGCDFHIVPRAALAEGEDDAP